MAHRLLFSSGIHNFRCFDILNTHVLKLSHLFQREGKPYCHKPCYSALFGPRGKQVPPK